MALARLEREAEQRAASLGEELQRAVAKLRAYEALEQEIDGAVMRGGPVEEALLRGIPCSPERRVRQAVQLVREGESE